MKCGGHRNHSHSCTCSFPHKALHIQMARSVSRDQFLEAISDHLRTRLQEAAGERRCVRAWACACACACTYVWVCVLVRMCGCLCLYVCVGACACGCGCLEVILTSRFSAKLALLSPCYHFMRSSCRVLKTLTILCTTWTLKPKIPGGAAGPGPCMRPYPAPPPPPPGF